MFDLQEVAIRLVEERARHSFSQNALAEKTGKSRQQYINYETGRSEMTVGFLYELNQLGFDIHYIITGVRNADIKKPTSEPTGQINNIQGNVSGVITGAGSTVHQVNTNQHITRTKAEVKAGIEHITDEQKANLQRLVNKIVELEGKYRTAGSAKNHQAVWRSLNAKLKVTSYHLIPLDKYETARKHLQSWIGRLNSSKTATKKNSDGVRKSRYAYVYTNLKKFELDEWFREYLQDKHGVLSMTELDDKRLDQAYHAVAYQVRKLSK